MDMTSFTSKKGTNKDKYLKKVKLIINNEEILEKTKDLKGIHEEIIPQTPETAKEVLYPVCPMLSRGNHQHRCINTECVAYKNGYCHALQTKVEITLI